MLRILIICLATLTLSACATTGNQSLKDETEASVENKITEGRTTQAQVQQMFGSPISTSFTSAGDEVWTYQFATMQADAVNFIPVVSAFGSSVSGKQKELVILFDRRDVVKRFSMTDSNVSTKSGLFR